VNRCAKSVVAAMFIAVAGSAAAQTTADISLTRFDCGFRENYDSNGVPTFNNNRADTMASLDRFKKLAANLQATVIIQHDARDIDKLPAFPASAK
jgi:N-acyl homoserine lactone hydrolase